MKNIKSLTEVNNQLFYDGLLIDDIIEKAGTPTYVYSEIGIKNTVKKFVSNTKVKNIKYKYAIKANTNTEVIKLINSLGFGADVVSLGEVYAALKAGVKTEDIVFAGMGKTIFELEKALELNVGYISVESIWELEQLKIIFNVIESKTRLIIRTNLNVDGSTHPYLTTGREENKFGINSEDVLEKYKIWQLSWKLPIDGVQVHIGSQIVNIDAFNEAADITIAFTKKLIENNSKVDIVDFGGGVGVSYDGIENISLAEYGKVIEKISLELNVQIFLEPGRYLVATNGVIISSIIYLKKGLTKNFVVADVAMNDFIRPALYSAYHRVIPYSKENRFISEKDVDIVGPVCESGDFVGLSRKKFPLLETGDHIVIADCGAYGYVMSSNYNMRGRPAEVLIRESGDIEIIRERESLEDII